MHSSNLLHIRSVSPLAKQVGISLAQAMNKAPDYRFILHKKENKTNALSWFYGSFVTKLALKYGRILGTENGDAGIYTFAPGKNPSLFSTLLAGVLMLPKHFGWAGAIRAIYIGTHLEKRRLTLLKQDHWYVIAVGVKPSQQGNGTGISLLKAVMQYADRDQAPIYLEVFEEELIPLYERLGFSVIHKDQLKQDLTLWCLQRPANNF